MDVTELKNRNLVFTITMIVLSINIVGKTQTHRLITLRGWKPSCLCSMPSEEILVIMDIDYCNQTQVLRLAP